jgi:hypothetical protein
MLPGMWQSGNETAGIEKLVIRVCSYTESFGVSYCRIKVPNNDTFASLTETGGIQQGWPTYGPRSPE